MKLIKTLVVAATALLLAASAMADVNIGAGK